MSNTKNNPIGPTGPTGRTSASASSTGPTGPTGPTISTAPTRPSGYDDMSFNFDIVEHDVGTGRDILISETTVSANFLEQNIFTSTNIIIGFWVLGVVLIIYSAFLSDKHLASKIINIVLIVMFLFIVTYIYMNMSDDERHHLLKFSIEFSRGWCNNPVQFLWTIVFGAGLYLSIFIFRIPMDENKPFAVKIVEGKFWGILFMFLIVFFFKYILQIPIVDIICDELEQLLSWGTKESNEIRADLTGGQGG